MVGTSCTPTLLSHSPGKKEEEKEKREGKGREGLAVQMEAEEERRVENDAWKEEKLSSLTGWMFSLSVIYASGIFLFLFPFPIVGKEERTLCVKRGRCQITTQARPTTKCWIVVYW